MGRPFKYIQSVFNRGELSPRIIGRVDNDAYFKATKYSRNMIPFPQGAVTKRTGTVYVATQKTSSTDAVLIPFRYSTVQNYIIELGDLYMRFYRNRGQVELAGVPYEVVTPWPASVVRELKFVQSYDRLYVFHPDYQTRVISRTGDTSWSIATLTFIDGPFLPENATATTLAPSATSGSVTVTASPAVFVAGDVGRQIRYWDGTNYRYLTITAYTSGTQVTALVEGSGSLGSTTATTKWSLSYFGGSMGWPAVGTIFEERLIMGRTKAYPATVFASTTGGFGATATMSPSNSNGTVVDDNGFVYTIGDDQVNSINWLSSGRTLMIGTSGGEHSMTGGTNSSYAPITPSNVTIKRESKTGSAPYVRPSRVGNAILYTSPSSLKQRELFYDFGIDSYISRDVTLFNDHITKSGIVDADFQQEPDPCQWFALNDGSLVGFSYEKVNQVEGWHKHTLGGTDAKVKAVATIPRPDSTGEDLWMIVSRTIGGATVRTIEYLSPYFTGEDKSDAYFVDCGSTYDGYLQASITLAATTGTSVLVTASSGVFTASMVGRRIEAGGGIGEIASFVSSTQVRINITNAFAALTYSADNWSVSTTMISGISWLNGETVSVLSDGAYAGEYVVSGGAITIDDYGSKVHVGLPYNAELWTLPVEATALGTIAGNTRRTHKIYIYVTDTIGMRIGSNTIDSIYDVPFGGGTQTLGNGPDLFSGILEIDPPMSFDLEGVVKIIHEWPTNITINYIAQEMSING